MILSSAPMVAIMILLLLQSCFGDSIEDQKLRNFGSSPMLRGFTRGPKGEILAQGEGNRAPNTESDSLRNTGVMAYDIGDHDLGFTSTAIAVLGGDITALDLLIGAGVDIDMPSPNGWTPLMFAARTGSEEMVEYILDHGANARLLSDSQESAFSIAVGADHRLVALMIADVNILQAMRASDDESMMDMIRAGGNVNIANAAGWTPLIYITNRGDYKHAEELIVKYRADVNKVEADGWSALMFACFHGNLDLVKLLMRYGADTSITSKSISPLSGRKLTALSVATFKHFPDIVRVLTKYRPVSGLRAKQFAIL